jgi:hypothetical protein
MCCKWIWIMGKSEAQFRGFLRTQRTGLMTPIDCWDVEGSILAFPRTVNGGFVSIGGVLFDDSRLPGGECRTPSGGTHGELNLNLKLQKKEGSW